MSKSLSNASSLYTAELFPVGSMMADGAAVLCKVVSRIPRAIRKSDHRTPCGKRRVRQRAESRTPFTGKTGSAQGKCGWTWIRSMNECRVEGIGQHKMTNYWKRSLYGQALASRVESDRPRRRRDPSANCVGGNEGSCIPQQGKKMSNTTFKQKHLSCTVGNNLLSTRDVSPFRDALITIEIVPWFNVLEEKRHTAVGSGMIEAISRREPIPS